MLSAAKHLCSLPHAGTGATTEIFRFAQNDKRGRGNDMRIRSSHLPPTTYHMPVYSATCTIAFTTPSP